MEGSEPGVSKLITATASKWQRTWNGKYKENACNSVMDWPLENHSSLRIAAPLTINFQIIIATSRILGCHPHSFLPSIKIVTTTKLAKLYSTMWMVFITVVIAFEIRQIVLCLIGNYRGSKILKIINRISILLGHLISTLFSITRANNFENAIARIQDFDEATCTANKLNILANIAAGGSLISTWCYIFWIARLFDSDIDTFVILNVLSMCILSLEIYKFCFVFVALLRRYVRLTTIAASGKIKIGLVASKGGTFYRHLTVQNLLTFHHWLADAASNFNRYYDVQLVYWIVYFISDLEIQLYVLANDSLGSSIEPNRIARLVFALYHPALICAVSHFTCKRANELGKILFDYRKPSVQTTVSSLEILEFGFYLFKQPLSITGLKMFCVNLPLLLSMIEASATYSTFIIQNALEVHRKSAAYNTTKVQ